MYQYDQILQVANSWHLVIVLIYIICTCAQEVNDVETRKFPKLFNAAFEAKISTAPTDATCGVPSRSQYCRSSQLKESVSVCSRADCIQDCAARSSLPTFVKVLSVASFVSDVCPIPDFVNKIPGSSHGEFSYEFSQKFNCMMKTILPSAGQNGAFTVTFWIRQSTGNFGTVFEKQVGNLTVFSIQVETSSVIIKYRTGNSDRQQVLSFTSNIPADSWSHLAIQVFDTYLSLFLNGTSVDSTPHDTRLLAGQVLGRRGNVYVGQSLEADLQLVGRLQKLYYFTTTLSNREIDEVMTGTLPWVHTLPRCRCKPSHPRTLPGNSRFCIKNGVPDTSLDRALRIDTNSHPLQYANDNDPNSFWVSSFLDNVTITIDMMHGQFQVFYVVLQFYSPLPRAVVIERKKTEESDWEAWQFFADDCQKRFGMKNTAPLLTPSSVNCIKHLSLTNSSVVPYSKGNVTFILLTPDTPARPGFNDFYNVQGLKEFVKATHVRVGLHGHFYVDDNNSLSRHRYFGIYEITVSARCNCHGHAKTCDEKATPYVCDCDPDSYTEGLQCERCKPLYNDKAYKDGDQLNAYPCKKCECYDHADECLYSRNEDAFPASYTLGGGGVCVDCRHNTAGRQCEECKDSYFRPLGKDLRAVDVCHLCNCTAAGVANSNMLCEKVGGQCQCKTHAAGRRCEVCEPGFFHLKAVNPDGCEPCNCNVSGTIAANISCHISTGQCYCKSNVMGLKCSDCKYGYFSLSRTNRNGCTPCNCNPLGSSMIYCDPVGGQCLCKDNVTSRMCDECADGFYDFLGGCKPCACNELGMETGTFCDKKTGQCVCKLNAAGWKCDECMDEHWNLGASAALGCISCDCSTAGTVNGTLTCDAVTGACMCKKYTVGRECNRCHQNSWGIDEDNPEGCQLCDCDPSGTEFGESIYGNLTCDPNTGQCTCMPMRTGRRCDTCVEGFYVNPSAGGGCLECDCHPRGALPGSTCDPDTGQCVCVQQNSGVSGLACDQCLTGFYQFDPGTGRCSPCNCDPAGSLNLTCHPYTGACQCKPYTTGAKCDTCIEEASNLDQLNPFGCSKTPSQQPPPIYEPLGPTSLKIKWQEPDYPNGFIRYHYLYREGKLLAQVPASEGKEFIDTGLTPFSNYTYHVESQNDFGRTRSAPVIFRTPPGTPNGTFELTVNDVEARSAHFSWNEPTIPNGPITGYQVVSIMLGTDNITIHWSGNALEVTLTDLIPFTAYSFFAVSCTDGGCLDSESVEVTTLEAVPQGLAPPVVQALSSTELNVTWMPPSEPNGVIIFYELWFRGKRKDEQGNHVPSPSRVFHPAGWYNARPTLAPLEDPLLPPATNWTQTGLDAYTEYQFQVIAENGAGKKASAWATGRTKEDTPLYMNPPVVNSVSSRQFNVSWDRPKVTDVRGNITEYRVYVLVQSTVDYAPKTYAQLLALIPNTKTWFVTGNYKPYTTKTFFVGVCNFVACVNSSLTSGRTAETAPAELGQPVADGYNSTTMHITWNPPVEPNGPPPEYTLHRMSTAFSNPPPSVEHGSHFTGSGYYMFDHTMLPENTPFTGVDLYFKTRHNTGLILFATSPGTQEEVIAIQLRTNRPYFLFDPQGCFFQVTPTDDEGIPYSDNMWHHLVVRRSGDYGNITLDDVFFGDKISDCNSGTIVGSNTGVYVGGRPKDFVDKRIPLSNGDYRLQVTDDSFRGCLRDIKILVQEFPVEVWKTLDFNEAVISRNLIPAWNGCPNNLQDGIHFMGQGYATFLPTFFRRYMPTVREFRISFEMRTEQASGVLWYLHGGRAGYYMFLQMYDNVLQLRVKYNDFDASLEIQPDKYNISLCDTNWHAIYIEKTAYGVGMRVDFTPTESNTSVNVDTVPRGNRFAFMFVGGVPPGSQEAQYIQEDKLYRVNDFSGCMRNILLNNREANFARRGGDSLNVNLDGCPQSVDDPVFVCEDPTMTEIYTGNDTETFDHDLESFTEYIYELTASNDVGNVTSTWAAGRTKHGVPTGVFAPHKATPLTGYVMEVFWRPPSGRTGLITKYDVVAYDMERPEAEPIVSSFDPNDYVETFDVELYRAGVYEERKRNPKPKEFDGNITGLIPFTNYSLRLIVYTDAGSTESEEQLFATTLEEAPEQVLPPTAEVSPHSLLLSWKPPQRPNGEITGYFLSMDGELQSVGGQMSYLMENLQVYTSYDMSVTACSRVGCTKSDEVTITTAQLPPSFMEAPAVSVTGNDSLYVEWQKPDQLNGVLQEYVIEVTVQNMSYIAYNSSDMYENFEVRDLTAGMEHLISVAACTAGGCRWSEPVAGTTAEGAPDGVELPDITSPNNSTLFVTWSPPLHPNGVVIRYELVHNGLMRKFDNSTFNYTITGLAPYSSHRIRLSACTEQGCRASSTVEVRTQEGRPVGNIKLQVQVLGSRSVAATWNAPAITYGIMTYDVYIEGLFYIDTDVNNYTQITDTRLFYSGNVSSEWVNITGLIPDALYLIQVNASNSAGFLLSNVEEFRTVPGSPDGMQLPALSSPSPYSVLVTWAPPRSPNTDGVVRYQLEYRKGNGSVNTIFPDETTATSYLLSDLQPFTDYSFRLTAVNDYGRTATEWVEMITLQDRPFGLDPPMLDNVTATNISLFWTRPLRDNGILTHYNIFQNGAFKLKVPGNTTSIDIMDLKPFTRYLFTLEACTDAGCSASLESSVTTTMPAIPGGISAPELIAESPTSVLIIWEPPKLPNGDLLTYNIERRLPDSEEVTAVGTFLPSDNLRYVDSSVVLSPFTEYEYRIKATNIVGTGVGPWQLIRTKSARPGGVRAPNVQILGPRSLNISWLPPVTANGQLDYYLVRLPQPRITVKNISINSIVVEDLLPYTDYNVSLQVCNVGGGCTESPVINIQTQPTTPEGQAPPLATPISQTIISVVWEPPSMPNGPNIRYQLGQRKLREPLKDWDAASSNEIWDNIYYGNETFYEVRGLTTYATYIYRVTVTNDVGYMVSLPSEEVTTFAGIPEVAAQLHINVMDHVNVFASWTVPSIYELSGGIQEYIIHIVSDEVNSTRTIDSRSVNVVLEDLTPSTDYLFTLETVVHGGNSITGEAVFARTLDGAPEGLPPPNVSPVSDTALQVTWNPPSRPNGEVIGYYLYIDGNMTDLNTKYGGVIVIDDLKPFTVYTLQVEVCTVFDCVESESIQATTAEALPEGVMKPDFLVMSSNSIQLQWLPPREPNGIIMYYELLRKDFLPCLTRLEPAENPVLPSCSYVKCRLLELQCGDKCYSDDKVCCDGVIHDKKPLFECCGKGYIPVKTKPTDVCCGGRYHDYQSDHSCCRDRYVRVGQAEQCCGDPEEDRVDIGLGDACCINVPYMIQNSTQICCDGKLQDGYGLQCCGGNLVDENLLCCGDETQGLVYTMREGYICCGSQYVSESLSMCCADDRGNTKVHSFLTAETKNTFNGRCCGTEVVASSLSCCNAVGFNAEMYMCADKGDTGDVCGTGTMCAISERDTSMSQAYCDECDFNINLHTCGTYVHTSSDPAGAERKHHKCEQEVKKVYIGEDLIFIDTGLFPFTTYEYSVVAVNSVGEMGSASVNATTHEEPPIGVQAPTWFLKPDVVNTVYLNWSDPTNPNGVITSFVLMRNGVELYEGLTYSYADSNNVQPYKVYIYNLKACTKAGCTVSDSIKVATLEVAPSGVKPVVVIATNPRLLKLFWSTPTQPNGIITEYNITVRSVDGTEEHISFEPDVFWYDLKDLEPYTNYKITLTACTIADCTESVPVTARTPEAPPEGLAIPIIAVINSQVAEIHWTEPSKPNGILLNYTVLRDAYHIFTASTDILKYRDDNLTPGGRHTYHVNVANSAGTTQYPSATVEMPLVTPANIQAPTSVVAISATEIYVEWPLLEESTIDEYQIMLDAGKQDSRTLTVGRSGETTLSGMKPYTTYAVQIRACLRGIANSCGLGPAVEVTTLEDVPAGIKRPILDAIGPNTVEITWEPPMKPNGLITEYRITRRVLDQAAELLINIVPGSAEDLYFINTGPDLLPFTEYEYQVTAFNVEGQVGSPWTYVRTLEDLPEGVPVPDVTALSGYTMQVVWSEPKKPNGIIKRYVIEFREKSGRHDMLSKHMTVAGEEYMAHLSGLNPYTSYQIRVVAINSAGKTAGDWVAQTTLQASPAGIQPFSMERIDTGRALILRWSPPARPNGVITKYVVYDREMSTPIYQGINRFFEYRRLQPFSEYEVLLEACTYVGCARGNYETLITAEISPTDAIPPIFTHVNATAVEISWRPPIKPNGLVTKYELLRRRTGMLGKAEKSNGVIIHALYGEEANGSTFSYLDHGLRPYTKYEYSVSTSNSRGHVSSEWQSVQTMQAPPEGMQAPVVKHVNTDPFSLHVVWLEPVNHNGVIQSYQLRRNDSTPLSFSPSEAKSFIDAGLKAFTMYSYTITACNAGGCTTSAPTYLRTLETAPLHVEPPLVNPVNSTALQVTWTPPKITNGDIIRFELVVDGVTVYSGLDQEKVLTRLVPYQEYEFILVTCTNGGCSESTIVRGRPTEAAPFGMSPPTLLVMGSNSIQVSWSPPTSPNGRIVSYELRRNGELIYTGLALSHQDFGLNAGIKYTYRVTAYNNIGSVVSPEASSITYSSSPEGLQPPKLYPLSSSSIRAEWSPPYLPNGDIFNYTLLLDNNMVFTGMGFSFVVRGLKYFTEYTFRVQACTALGCTVSQPVKAQTLEAPPTGQSPPILQPQANQDGAHEGVLVKWHVPRQPNGIVLYYELYRRKVERQPAQVKYSSRSLVYNGTFLTYLDKDPLLMPYAEYEYMVVAVSSAGRAESIWTMVRTYEAAPTSIDPPTLRAVTATTATVDIRPPQQPNGDIISYTILVNGTKETSSKLTVQTIGYNKPLHPFTTYTASVIACTASGCATSQPVVFQTLEAAPSGLMEPIVSNITATSALIRWMNPAEPNGIISKFELHLKMACPASSQPVDKPCVESMPTLIYSGPSLKFNLTGLTPYTNYLVQLLVHTKAGTTNSTWQLFTTSSAAPEYIMTPSITVNERTLVLDWSKSFRLNGQLHQYILYTNGYKTYSGFGEQSTLVRENLSKKYTIMVTLITHVGNVSSDPVTFDPEIHTTLKTAVGGTVYVGTPKITSPPVTTTTTVAPKPIIAYFKETWFIVLMSLLGVMLIFIILACCLKNTGHRSPYQRERLPLPPKPQRQPKLWPESYPCYDSTIGYVEPPYDQGYNVAKGDYPQAFNHYANHAYDQGSLVSLSPSLPVNQTGRFLLDEDDDLAWVDRLSSVHPESLLDDDLYSTVRSHPYSITHKQHQIFPDSHL